VAQKTWEDYRLEAMLTLLERLVFKGITPDGAAVAWLRPLAEATADADVGLRNIRKAMKKTDKAAKKTARKKARAHARTRSLTKSRFASSRALRVPATGKVNGHSHGGLSWPGTIPAAPPWHPESGHS
jgi:hypothetical protein